MIPNRRLLIFCFLLSSFSAIHAQYRSVGLNTDKHLAEVVDKSFSADKLLVATISNDKTLKVWDFPSLILRKSINLPEDGGNEGLPGICRMCPNNSDLVFVTESKSSPYSYKDAPYLDIGTNEIPSFSFYVIDWRVGRVLGKYGAMTSPITDFIFCESSPLMIVTSAYENVSVYDVSEMRLLNSYAYDDERILGAAFVGNGEIVVITDMYYYRYEITGNGYLERVCRKNIRTGFLKTVPLHDVFINDKDDIVYLFGTKSAKGEICLSTGKKTHTDTYPEYSYSADTLFNIQNVKYLPSNSDNGYVSGFHYLVSRGTNNLLSLHKRAEQSLSDDLFTYRENSSPRVKVNHNDIVIGYAGDSSSCRLSKRGLETVDSVFSKKPRHIYSERYAAISSTYDFDLFMARDTILYQGCQVFMIDNKVIVWKGNQRTVISTAADDISRWINPHHFLICLKDGTLKWFNTHSLEEELSLFITKDGEWIIWLPDGRYNSSSDKSGNMIEWKYRILSLVETRKPKDGRRLYYRPEVLESVIDQLFDNTKKNLEYVTLAERDIFFIKKMSTQEGIDIEYGINGYDPIENGPYDVYAAFVGDKRYDVSFHVPYDKGGFIQINSTEIGSPLVEFKGRNSLKLFPLEAVDFNQVFITSLGISEYMHCGWHSLKAPRKDAYDVAVSFNEILASRRSAIDQQILYDSDACYESIRQRVNDIAMKLSTNSLAIFYFSGHGVCDTTDNSFYFVTGEGDKIDIASLINYCESFSGYKLFIVDACYSGLLGEIDCPKNTAILWSCGADEHSLDGKEMDRSPYTEEMIRYINNCFVSGKTLSLGELGDHMSSIDLAGQSPSYIDNIKNLLIVL